MSKNRLQKSLAARQKNAARRTANAAVATAVHTGAPHNDASHEGASHNGGAPNGASRHGRPQNGASHSGQHNNNGQHDGTGLQNGTGRHSGDGSATAAHPANRVGTNRIEEFYAGILEWKAAHAARLEAAAGPGKAELPPARIDPINRAVRLILGDGAEPCIDFTQMSVIRRRSREGDPRRAIALPLSSKGTMAWMARLLFQADLPQLSQREQAQALLVLEGLAQENCEPGDFADVVEGDPVAFMLGALVRMETTWTGSATDLLELLIHLGQQAEMFAPDHPGWPRSPAQLTRRLGVLSELLQEMGIIHETRRSGWHRFHIFRLAADTTPPAAAGDAAADEAEAVNTESLVDQHDEPVAPQVADSIAPNAEAEASSPVASHTSSFASPVANEVCNSNDDRRAAETGRGEMPQAVPTDAAPARSSNS